MNKWQKIGLAVGMGAATITTAHLINKLIFKSSVANDYTGKSERLIFKWKFGDISYIKKGSGTPLLLIHDLNTYSSSYEWNNVIDEFAKNNTVYAIDLLGCGHSDKPNLTYTTFMYTQLINDFISMVIKKKSNVIATGDSAPIAIITAYNNNSLINKIILVSPQSVKEAMKIPDKRSNARRFLLNIPVIGTNLYNILVNRRNINYLLARKTFLDGIVPNDVLNAYHENAHISGASSKYVFISTQCHYTTVAISKALSELNNCIYMINGEGMSPAIDEYTGINPAVEVIRIKDAGKLPQIEKPLEFVKQSEIFLN